MSTRTGTAGGSLPLADVLKMLGSMGVGSLLVEGGAGLFRAFLGQQLAERQIRFTQSVQRGSINVIADEPENVGAPDVPLCFVQFAAFNQNFCEPNMSFKPTRL